MEDIRHISETDDQTGFSLIEMLIVITITLTVLSLASSLLAESLKRKSREETQAATLADANLGLSRMSQEIMNAGFGLKTNGIVAADSGEETIRIRANLNALMRQTSSGTVTDQREDVAFSLVANPNGGSSLVRTDISTRQSSILATHIDDADVDNDGDGDGLTFTYFDENGTEVTPADAVRVAIEIRVMLPQVGIAGSAGFQPEVKKKLSSSVILRNSRLSSY
jgi:prepilin-type N-terminal cleavage/methylation domain-containing protein